MPRQLPIQYPGAMYHVMSRADRREDIFPDDADWWLGEHGLQQDTAAARQELERRMEARRLQSGHEEGLTAPRGGWCLGSEGLKKRMLEQIEGKLGQHHSGELRRETAQAKAERIIAQELRRLGWKEADLGSRRKSDTTRLGMAARIRRETTLSIKGIAARLHSGTSKSANIRLHAAMRPRVPVRPARGRVGL